MKIAQPSSFLVTFDLRGGADANLDAFDLQMPFSLFSFFEDVLPLVLAPSICEVVLMQFPLFSFWDPAAALPLFLTSLTCGSKVELVQFQTHLI
ncbi:hypothetical protein Vi05172_g12755 [Venturia inaequalis]|nr:hypothetical protein Vi05172_g12755 [Venturia inaequalis]